MIRYILRVIDWCRDEISLDVRLGASQDDDERGVDLMVGNWTVQCSRVGVALLRIDRMLEDDDDGDPDAGECTARVFCDESLRAVLVDAVERGRNGDDPHEAAGTMLREMELDEVEQAVENGSGA